ncbi:bifunctional phosphoribosyl-AMP cyclohydrolase/phosphoribosyl-ATP diphosphatase HisIE [Hippea jasoniae]|uniref:bifunctional phosphoribosyl-AMP cyclohydrolase/phosphoribosyl-ATP diphosphatase HisIE n=1 Tax=Hippea jasoniae TaxID=944479 RepID=UPI000551213B|nr:bifunctional phosphoribosyl-AMP cyclohydrolase/phosphoribosyl-ATP diphosphatase HisIE [Hippea jasoniae]
MENFLNMLKFDNRGLIPVIVVDFYNNEVLMLAWANKEAVKKTIETGFAHYFSRSRQKLWKKGETSGHTQKIKRILFDCDEDTLMYVVEQKGAACHTNHRSCFFREYYRGSIREIAPVIEGDDIIYDLEEKHDILRKIYNLLLERKQTLPQNSYTATLFKTGDDKILKKVAEETAEVIIAAKNNEKSEIVYEAADLIFHLLVLFAQKELPPEAVLEELSRRFGISGKFEKETRQ